MQAGDTLNSSYVLESRIGKSLLGETWFSVAGDACINARPGAKLVLKILSLGDMPDWKGYDLFEREAAALKSMNHEGIPRYVDSFRLEQEGSQFIVLAMERVEGQNLATEVENGRRFTETEIQAMIADILEIASYLHDLRPPVIHRDINPKNIMHTPDGSIALVDFSGVQDAVRLAYRDTSTMVGTAGYAPVEQISGRASVRSDLYAIAATAAFLVTRKHPSDLPLKNMCPDPGAVVELSPALACVLDNYLQADEAKRNLPVADAIAILRGTKKPYQEILAAEPAPVAQSGDLPTFMREGPLAEALGRLTDRLTERIGSASDNDAPVPVFGAVPGANHVKSAKPESLPSDSKVTIVSNPTIFSIDIPKAGLKGGTVLFGLGFSAIWLGFVAFWTLMSISMGAPIFFTLFSVPFWAVGIFMARMLVVPAFTDTKLSIAPETGFSMTDVFLGRSKTKNLPLSDLGACSVQKSNVSQNGRTELEIVLEAGTKSIRFGRALSDREKRAIASSISAWLTAYRRDK